MDLAAVGTHLPSPRAAHAGALIMLFRRQESNFTFLSVSLSSGSGSHLNKCIETSLSKILSNYGIFKIVLLTASLSILSAT
jgi:hypothetical protein